MTKLLPRPGSKRERALGLALDGLSPRQISQRLDIEPTTVRVILCQLRAAGIEIPKRVSLESYVTADIAETIDREANRRGMSRTDLVSLILSRAARDGLIAAVLDDEAEAA